MIFFSEEGEIGALQGGSESPEPCPANLKHENYTEYKLLK